MENGVDWLQLGDLQTAKSVNVNQYTLVLNHRSARVDIKKHGVSLSEGDGVLSDPLALTVEDDSAEGEQRFVTIGMNVFGALMVVVSHLSAEARPQGTEKL